MRPIQRLIASYAAYVVAVAELHAQEDELIGRVAQLKDEAGRFEASMQNRAEALRRREEKIDAREAAVLRRERALDSHARRMLG